MQPYQSDAALRVLVAPDSFKGSLAARDVARHIASGIAHALPNAVITEAPIADGGEGTARAVAAQLGGVWRTLSVLGANGEFIDMAYAVCRSAGLGEFVIFDVAEVVGLPDATVPVQFRTTCGVGQAVRLLAALGFRTIVIGLGGSSTSDGGAGMLAELMLHFTDAAGAVLQPVLDTLGEIDAVRRRDDTAWLAAPRVIGLTDVTSPLTGPTGATAVFGPQKGVTAVAACDARVAAMAAQVTALVGADHTMEEGAGAAGGLGFAIRVLGGTLQPGAQFILQALGLDRDALRFDWVITGEGRSDVQTLLGKGPATIARLARRHGIPVTLLSGAVDNNRDLHAEFDGCFSVQSAPASLEYAMTHAGPLLEAAAFNLARLFDSHRVRPA